MAKNTRALVIREASPDDEAVIRSLLSRLYKDYDPGDLDREIRRILIGYDETFFLAFYGTQALALAHVSLRRDYVEGAGIGPTGYLEALYVEPDHRLKGIGKNLVEACENRSRGKGSSMFASDSLLENEGSYRFHLAIGFCESSRNIHYIKRLMEKGSVDSDG